MEHLECMVVLEMTFSLHSPLMLLQGIGVLDKHFLGLILSYIPSFSPFFPQTLAPIHSFTDYLLGYLLSCYYTENPPSTSGLYFNDKKISKTCPQGTRSLVEEIHKRTTKTQGKKN